MWEQVLLYGPLLRRIHDSYEVAVSELRHKVDLLERGPPGMGPAIIRSCPGPRNTRLLIGGTNQFKEKRPDWWYVECSIPVYTKKQFQAWRHAVDEGVCLNMWLEVCKLPAHLTGAPPYRCESMFTWYQMTTNESITEPLFVPLPERSRVYVGITCRTDYTLPDTNSS